nr:hypothetical protein Itr_chr06CG17140 [Ipomoea trifida]
MKGSPIHFRSFCHVPLPLDILFQTPATSNARRATATRASPANGFLPASPSSNGKATIGGGGLEHGRAWRSSQQACEDEGASTACAGGAPGGDRQYVTMVGGSNGVFPSRRPSLRRRRVGAVATEASPVRSAAPFLLRSSSGSSGKGGARRGRNEQNNGVLSGGAPWRISSMKGSPIHFRSFCHVPLPLDILFQTPATSNARRATATRASPANGFLPASPSSNGKATIGGGGLEHGRAWRSSQQACEDEGASTACAGGAPGGDRRYVTMVGGSNGVFPSRRPSLRRRRVGAVATEASPVRSAAPFLLRSSSGSSEAPLPPCGEAATAPVLRRRTPLSRRKGRTESVDAGCSASGDATADDEKREGRGGGRNAMSPFCSARNGEGENELSPRRSASQPPARSTSTAPQHHGHTRTAGKERTRELPPRPPSTTAGATTAVKPSPRARLWNSPTGCHHATSPKVRRRSLSPPGLTMFAVGAPLLCRRLREAREKESRRLSCCAAVQKPRYHLAEKQLPLPCSANELRFHAGRDEQRVSTPAALLQVTPLPTTRRGRGGGRNAMSPFCSARNGEGENELSPRRSASQPPARSTATAPQHHGHTRTAGKERTRELPPRPPSTTAGATTAVKPSPRARLWNSPTGCHHATSPKVRRRSLSPPGLTMFAVGAPLLCRRLREAREKESRRLSCCG